MIINPSGLMAFGNMTKGGGLPAVFSPSTDYGYDDSAIGTTGWAGLSLTEPARIKRVSFTSTTSGFDASGSATPVTLRVYGKVGAALPANRTDGQLIASLSLTDPNAITTKDLLPYDLTKFNHVWGSITTGVWALATYIEIETLDDSELYLETPDLLTRNIYTKRFDIELALPWTSVELPATRWKPIQIPDACSATVDISCDFRHRGVGGYTGAVGIGWTFGRRYGATLEAMIAAPWVPFSDFDLSTQIATLSHHYATATRPGAITLDPGVYQFSFAGTAHSDATSADGLACVQVEGAKGLNGTRLIISTDPVYRV